MKAGHVVWDWNGTLLRDDGLGRRVMNDMLARRGLPELTRERYRELLTFPIVDYYRAAGLDLARESYEDLAREWVRGYEAGWRWCALEPGVTEVLDRVAGAGMTQSILSANRHDRLVEQLAHFGLSGRFCLVSGISDDLAHGKDHMAAGHMARLGISAADAVYVGDTLHDAQTAGAIGCRCILVTWGHQSEERLAASGLPLCRRPADLPLMLGLEEE